MEFHIIPVTPFAQNCSLLICPQTRQAAVVDPGGDVDEILAAVAKHQATLAQIWVTHGHLDHAGGVAELAKSQQLPIYGPHQDDEFWIENFVKQAQMFGFAIPETFTPDRWLTQGDTLTLGEQQVQVLHCPGHTPGHVCFYHDQSKLLIAGDVLFQGSIGRTDFPRGNLQQLLQAIQDNLLTLDDETRVITGHGPMTTIGRERVHNPYLSQPAF